MVVDLQRPLMKRMVIWPADVLAFLTARRKIVQRKQLCLLTRDEFVYKQESATSVSCNVPPIAPPPPGTLSSSTTQDPEPSSGDASPSTTQVPEPLAVMLIPVAQYIVSVLF
ncbi:hypothetical protein Dimus_017164 [Dionaea muscipula]